MSKLKIKARGMSMKAVGEDAFIEKEREAFLEFAENHKELPANVDTIFTEKIRPFPVGIDETNQESDNGEGNCMLKWTETVCIKTSWYDLSEMIRNGTANLNIGDSVKCTLTDGTETEFVVTDETDTYVRFESRDFIGETTYWNSSNTNKGGYPASHIRKYMDETIWELLPEDLRDAISTVDREWKDEDGYEEGVYSTKLFLPAASEVFNEANCYGDKELYEQLEWYKDARNRIRADEDGDARYWCTASVMSGSSTDTCCVSSLGEASSWGADNCTHVPVCFCIKKLIKVSDVSMRIY